jgi:hypothetical protein
MVSGKCLIFCECQMLERVGLGLEFCKHYYQTPSRISQQLTIGSDARLWLSVVLEWHCGLEFVPNNCILRCAGWITRRSQAEFAGPLISSSEAKSVAADSPIDLQWLELWWNAVSGLIAVLVTVFCARADAQAASHQWEWALRVIPLLLACDSNSFQRPWAT